MRYLFPPPLFIPLFSPFPSLYPSPVPLKQSHRLTSNPFHSTQGATPRELLLESCRRNNTSLLSDLLSSLSSPSPSSSSGGSGGGSGGGGGTGAGGGGSKEKIATLLNESRDPLGCFCLHVAAGCGSCEFFHFFFYIFYEYFQVLLWWGPFVYMRAAGGARMEDDGCSQLFIYI